MMTTGSRCSQIAPFWEVRGKRVPQSTNISFVFGVFCVPWFLKGMATQRRRNPRRLPRPPGPKGLPIVGNMLQLPTVKPWKEYAEMSRQYGDIVYLDAFGQGIVMLGSLTRAVDIMEKRAVNNSGRPYFPAIELIDMEWNFGFMPYGSKWKQYRRVFHQFMNHNAVADFYPIISEEIVKLLQTLSKNPGDFMEHMITSFGIIVLRSTYGFDDIGKKESLIHETREFVDVAMTVTIPGSFLVNTLPILKYVPEWFPGAGYQTHFREVAALGRRVLNLPFEGAKSDAANGERGAHPSMAMSLIDSLQEEGKHESIDHEILARAVCGVSYAGGVETTVSSSTGLIYILATHPEVQKKAQAELDAIVGPNRLPTIGDRESLPYIQAIVKEIGRWYTVIPLGIPHRSMEDDEYEGHFIPKGTLIFANAWAIMHDPELFERPFEFLPERYLKDGKIDPSVPDAEAAAFGFGRRKCPGRFFSNDAIFLFTASLLSTLNVMPPTDATDNPLPMKFELVDMPIAKPLPFKCDFVVRPGREGLLN